MRTSWYQSIAVGVDGSDESMSALDWAADAADRNGARLTLVTTYDPPPTPGPGLSTLIEDSRAEARHAALAAQNRLGERRPGGHDVEVLVMRGAAAQVLIQWSKARDLVVVGRRDVRALDRILLGSTSSALAASTPGTVAVVPDGAATGATRRIRVGVGRDDDPDVLGTAFAEAEARGCPLEVLHVLEGDPVASAAIGMYPAGATRHEAARSEVTDRMARWSEKYPRVSCTVVIRRRDPVGSLLHGLTPEDVLVVGGRRHTRIMGRVLRSVPDAVLRAAPCPVLVVHSRRQA